MITFQLRCAQDHEFEAWFRNNAAYDEQVANKEVACPICGDTDIRKAPMAPAISSSKRRAVNQQAEQMRTVAQMQQALTELRKNVEDNAEHVGKDFAEEARKIHYGETEERAIYGEATQEQREELQDEGIEVDVIPWIEDVKAN